MTIVLFERFFYRCFNYLWRRYLLSSAKGNAAVVAAANDGKTKRAPRPDQDHGDGEDGEGGDVGGDDGEDDGGDDNAVGWTKSDHAVLSNCINIKLDWYIEAFAAFSNKSKLF